MGTKGYDLMVVLITMPWVAQGITRDVLFVGDILQALADTNVDTIRIMTHLVLKDSLAPLEGMLVNRNMKIVCSLPGDQRCRIDAQASEDDLRRILRVVGGAQVTLEGLEFENGFFMLSGAGFEGAEKNEDGGSGGAIFVTDASCVTCNNCAFRSNQASSGGAVRVHMGLFSCHTCLFSSNTAKEGGAVNLRGEPHSYSRGFFEDTVFYANIARDQAGDAGGAVFTSYFASGVFSNTDFTQNFAKAIGFPSTVKGGGAMFFDNGGSATLVNARFHGNNITEHGRGPNILVDGLSLASSNVDLNDFPMMSTTGNSDRVPTMQEYIGPVPAEALSCMPLSSLSASDRDSSNKPLVNPTSSSSPPPVPSSRLDYETNATAKISTKNLLAMAVVMLLAMFIV
eukprot:CAMPEP_0114286258 /NCGR_PEP_ID=MMETSP0059-20121206/5658_1 /TAXON_ID=36894 /ORGANISM="Pyramimonas parkeae, Strain CCMP726" /LENGTH=397 /DNA_ID=CAMNT_0001407279 /DNA_START=55 /DNA_END=1249 /DNA_ORIENTATION=-